ncbi:MAG: YbhB/YbcL family Raf kinase inhibitor-like protein [Alphaproteobacteria bacterium]|nr:YbhB/YbcL family Raf kinase inhibitor-like protein [Myxococcales bacterium]MCB9691816.1 YbhB/YbcL family Raf kinase inhibitor-like protein [Alphaproteobacteria bacterium]
MHLRSSSFTPFARLDPKYAFGRHDARSHFAFSANTNPHLAWDGVPEGTRSFVVICVDHDVPSVGTDVNQEGRTVDVWLPRVPFYHWVLVDLPPSLRSIAEGAHASGVTVGGKAPGPTPDGGLQGVNDYTGWFAGNPDMGGTYAGYDGCGPPWNDERLHGYRFQVHALDVETLGLSGAFTGPDVVAAMAGHVLATAELIGLYAINPDV